jgi:hypothetical protein
MDIRMPSGSDWKDFTRLLYYAFLYAGTVFLTILFPGFIRRVFPIQGRFRLFTGLALGGLVVFAAHWIRRFVESKAEPEEHTGARRGEGSTS